MGSSRVFTLTTAADVLQSSCHAWFTSALITAYQLLWDLSVKLQDRWILLLRFAENDAVNSNCRADMNRHHYTLYVHNCRLVFLFRQDPSEGKTYKPAEFHWKLNQVSLEGHLVDCSSESHRRLASLVVYLLINTFCNSRLLFYRTQQCLFYLWSNVRFSFTFSSWIWNRKYSVSLTAVMSVIFTECTLKVQCMRKQEVFIPGCL